MLPGVAHSTSEKQKPGPLDLALLFRGVVDVKKVNVLTSTRELLFSSIAEYNKGVSNKVGGYVEISIQDHPCWICNNYFQIGVDRLVLKNQKFSEESTCHHEAWRVNEATRRLLYGILRCPAAFLDILKRATEYCAWKDSGQFVQKNPSKFPLFVLGCFGSYYANLCPEAFTLENLDGDWFVPGSVIGGPLVTDPFWKQVKAGVNKNPDF